MQTSEFQDFGRELTKHFELYPNSRMSEATISAWWDDLAEIPFDSVINGLELSRRGEGEFVPGCTRVKSLAEQHARMAFDAHRRTKLLVAKDQADNCTLPADNPWMQMAAYWEQENRHWEKHPEARPADATEQRFKQFWRMWGKVEGAAK